MKLVLWLAAIAAIAMGQTAPALPQDWIGAGGGFSPNASPKTTGWASIAVVVNKPNSVFSYSTYDVVPQKNAVPLVSVRTGAATVLRTFGVRLYLLGFATAGVSVSAVPTSPVAPATSGTATAASGSFSGGGMLLWRSKKAWTAELGVRLVTGSTSKVAEFGFGRTF